MAGQTHSNESKGGNSNDPDQDDCTNDDQNRF
jgi:hypothetical protein